MKKALLIIGGSVAAIALVVYIGVNFYLGSMVAAAVRKYGSQMTQTKVELDSAQISPFSGTGTLTGLSVGNPKGWGSDRAFVLGEIHVELVPSSILHDSVVINDLTVSDPIFDYETRIVTSNIGELLRNIESGSRSGTADKAKTAKGTPMRFAIHRLKVTGGKVVVGVGPAATSLSLPDFEMADLGTPAHPVTSDELAVLVMKALTDKVVVAAAKSTLKTPGVLGAAAGDSVMKAAHGLMDAVTGKK